MVDDAATDYVNATEESAADNVAIHVRPERWNTFGFRRMLDYCLPGGHAGVQHRDRQRSCPAGRLQARCATQSPGGIGDVAK